MIDERTYQAAIDRIEELSAELLRVRAERDRSVAVAVSTLELRGCTRADALESTMISVTVLGRTVTNRLPADIVAALAKHDKRKEGN